MSSSPDQGADQAENPERTPERRKLRITSAEDIFSAIRSSDLQVRYSVLKAVAENPAKAASYGDFQGRSLVDELVARWQDSEPDSSYRALLLAALTAFDDPRTIEIAKNDFTLCSKREVLEAAAACLARQPEKAARDFMRPFLFHGDRWKIRLAAASLNGHEGLDPSERVRLAVACPHDCSVPVLDPETEEFWVRELDGIWSEKAMVIIESMGGQAFQRLRRKWDILSDRLRVWVLQWGADKHPLYSVDLIAGALGKGSEKVILSALQAVTKINGGVQLFGTLLNGLLAHPSPTVIADALRAGADPGRQGMREMMSCGDIEVRKAAIMAVARKSDADNAAMFIELLRDTSWQIRAAAASGLESLGRPVIPEIKGLLNDPDENVRTAVAGVLSSMGEEKLISDTIKVRTSLCG